MRSMRSVQRQVELRRLGNQLSVLGKVNSLIKMVKCCVLCRCDLSGQRRARDNDIPGYRSSDKIRLPSRRCTIVPVAPIGGVKSTNSRFLRFFVRSVTVFLFAGVDTYASAKKQNYSCSLFAVYTIWLERFSRQPQNRTLRSVDAPLLVFGTICHLRCLPHTVFNPFSYDVLFILHTICQGISKKCSIYPLRLLFFSNRRQH